MALAETAELVAEMNLRGDFPRNAAKMQKGLDGLNKRTETLRKGLGKIGQGLAKGFKSAAVIGAGAVGFLAFNIAQGIESLAELEDVTNATNQAIKSTRGVAKVTADEVRKLAEKYEDLTTVDDKVVQGAENLLLSFTNIRRKAFEPTLAAALDMSTALDMDLNSAVRSLGRALQDPAKGLSRLTRLGVTFTAQEEEKIKALQASGRTLEAQQIILGKLNRLYGGRAKTAASGYRGSINRLKDSVEELQQSLAGPLIRPLTRVANKLAKFAKTKDIQQGIRGIGEAFASLFEDQIVMETDTEGGQSAQVAKRVASPFTTGLGLVKEAFNTVKTLPWEQIRSGLDQTFQVAAKAVDLFKGLPPELQTALVTLLAANKLTGGLVASGLKDIAGLALKSLTTITAANVTVIGKSVTGPGGSTPGTQPPGGGGGPGGGGPKAPGVTLPLVGAAIGGVTLADLMQGADRVEAIARQQLAEQRRQAALQAGESVTSKTGNAILTGVRGFVARAQEYAGLTARVVPRQFEETKQTTAAARLGAERTLRIPQMVNPFLSRIDQTQKQGNAQESTQGKTMTMLARLQANKAAEQVPILGSVKQAIVGVTSAVNRKDLSVRVAVSMTATTVAEGVVKSTSGNRVVIS